MSQVDETPARTYSNPQCTHGHQYGTCLMCYHDLVGEQRSEIERLRANAQQAVRLLAAVEFDGQAYDAIKGAIKLFSGDFTSAVETAEPLRVDWKASYEEVLRQRDALTADAARYRFLRDFTYVEAYYIDGAGGVDTKVRCEGSGERLNLAVDMERIKERSPSVKSGKTDEYGEHDRHSMNRYP